MISSPDHKPCSRVMVSFILGPEAPFACPACGCGLVVEPPVNAPLPHTTQLECIGCGLDMAITILD
jgi:transcription elongation factor Elf1